MLSTTADASSFTMPARARGHAATVSATRLKRPGQKTMPSLGLKAYALAYPGRAAVWCGVAVMALGITANALWLQKGQRLSPAAQLAAATLSSQPPLPPVRPAQQELARQIQTTPQQQAASTPVAMPQSAPATPVMRQAPAQPAPVVTQAANRRDEIGDLLKSQDGGGRASDGRSPVVGSETRNIAMAQRALIKLGYPVAKPDGRLGEETRIAIERFERERKLPVTRELSPRTQRELAAVAGIRFE
jgi:hypothetical protein